MKRASLDRATPRHAMHELEQSRHHCGRVRLLGVARRHGDARARRGACSAMVVATGSWAACALGPRTERLENTVAVLTPTTARRAEPRRAYAGRGRTQAEGRAGRGRTEGRADGGPGGRRVGRAEGRAGLEQRRQARASSARVSRRLWAITPTGSLWDRIGQALEGGQGLVERAGSKGRS